MPKMLIGRPSRDAEEFLGFYLDALEEEVVPLYYDRKDSAFSPEWVRRTGLSQVNQHPVTGVTGCGIVTAS